MTVRRGLYAWAKVLGDLNAVKRRRVGDRIWNRSIGRLAGKLLGKVER